MKKTSEDNIKIINELVEKAINFLYLATVLASIGINLFDIFRLIESSNMFILFTNIPAIIIILVSFLLKITGIINLKTSFTIVVICIMANSIVSITQSEYLDDFVIGILRESIFMAFLISLSAFMVSKYLAYFVSVTYCAFIITLYIFTRDHYLLENMPVIILIFFAYTYFINYLIMMLNRATRELQEKNLLIKEQLEEITSQNEELSQMNEELNVQHEMLEAKNEMLNARNVELHASRNELKKLNDTKNKLFSVIGHDIKNLMHIIMGFSKLLTEKYNSLTEDKKKSFIESIDSSIRKLSRLLEDLLTWSKTQQKQINFSPENIAIIPLIKETADIFDTILKNKKIGLLFSTENDLMVFADKNMVSVVIRNLMDNAIKFSYPDGQIKISAKTSKNNVVISISDNGISIPADMANQIFEINDHNSRNGTKGEKGSGFGLAICKEFMELNKGRIWLENMEDEKVFNFSLPMAKGK